MLPVLKLNFNLSIGMYVSQESFITGDMNAPQISFTVNGINGIAQL